MKVLRIRAIATVALGLSVVALVASGQEFALDSAVGLELVNVEAAPEHSKDARASGLPRIRKS